MHGDLHGGLHDAPRPSPPPSSSPWLTDELGAQLAWDAPLAAKLENLVQRLLEVLLVTVPTQVHHRARHAPHSDDGEGVDGGVGGSSSQAICMQTWHTRHACIAAVAMLCHGHAATEPRPTAPNAANARPCVPHRTAPEARCILADLLLDVGGLRVAQGERGLRGLERDGLKLQTHRQAGTTPLARALVASRASAGGPTLQRAAHAVAFNAAGRPMREASQPLYMQSPCAVCGCSEHAAGCQALRLGNAAGIATEAAARAGIVQHSCLPQHAAIKPT